MRLRSCIQLDWNQSCCILALSATQSASWLPPLSWLPPSLLSPGYDKSPPDTWPGSIPTHHHPGPYLLQPVPRLSTSDSSSPGSAEQGGTRGLDGLNPVHRSSCWVGPGVLLLGTVSLSPCALGFYPAYSCCPGPFLLPG